MCILTYVLTRAPPGTIDNVHKAQGSDVVELKRNRNFLPFNSPADLAFCTRNEGAGLGKGSGSGRSESRCSSTLLLLTLTLGISPTIRIGLASALEIRGNDLIVLFLFLISKSRRGREEGAERDSSNRAVNHGRDGSRSLENKVVDGGVLLDTNQLRSALNTGGDVFFDSRKRANLLGNVCDARKKPVDE